MAKDEPLISDLVIETRIRDSLRDVAAVRIANWAADNREIPLPEELIREYIDRRGDAQEARDKMKEAIMRNKK